MTDHEQVEALRLVPDILAEGDVTEVWRGDEKVAMFRTEQYAQEYVAALEADHTAGSLHDEGVALDGYSFGYDEGNGDEACFTLLRDHGDRVEVEINAYGDTARWLAAHITAALTPKPPTGAAGRTYPDGCCSFCGCAHEGQHHSAECVDKHQKPPTDAVREAVAILEGSVGCHGRYHCTTEGENACPLLRATHAQSALRCRREAEAALATITDALADRCPCAHECQSVADELTAALAETERLRERINICHESMNELNYQIEAKEARLNDPALVRVPRAVLEQWNEYDHMGGTLAGELLREYGGSE